MNNLEYFKTLEGKDIISKIKEDTGNSFVSVNENLNGTGNKVIGIKDNHAQKDYKTTACSQILSNGVSLYDSTVVSLLKENGYEIAGHLNMDEFAMGGENKTSFYGGVNSALNDDYYAGGSSGGSAYAVARGLIPVATGSDTGGSIRQPAAINGVYGMKPTYGLISRFGTIAFASSFDVIGAISNTIEDNMEVIEALAKNDDKDQTNYVPDNYTLEYEKVEELKVAYIKEWMEELEDGEVKSALEEEINELKSLGYTVEEVSIPTLKYSLELYMILAYGEASANLSRYDGVRFGLVNDTNKFDSYRNNFGNEIKKRLVMGSYFTSSLHSKEYLKKAQEIRSKMQKQMYTIFEAYDIVIGPTIPSLGLKKDEEIEDRLRYYYDFFLMPANLTGLPSFSMPIKDASKDNMKISIQLLANKFEENKIYAFAKTIRDRRNNE